MAKTVIDINEEALALAAEVLGTTTKKDTVNAALEEIGARLRRERALEALIALDEDGAFDKGREPGFKEEVRG
ncbi:MULTISPECIES: type II toxin-antitoxin system VapB family antitoxin [unclassified Streptomyces]|uniref:type II toxin-antitoxin system VapB family antitoxin n=1 Tax=unclassified Streptomyces TaxID=2593676 RepID=UPI00224D0D9D|nr:MULTISPECIES: type II toxin-antitoxin system VapB family antitoxin [unclassified Streptomyces]MCX4629905.1 type II toxin-antitoxin system VapB family antitoxin [Streptomyces sp. NBC_01443]